MYIILISTNPPRPPLSLALETEKKGLKWGPLYYDGPTISDGLANRDSLILYKAEFWARACILISNGVSRRQTPFMTGFVDVGEDRRNREYIHTQDRETPQRSESNRG